MAVGGNDRCRAELQFLTQRRRDAAQSPADRRAPFLGCAGCRCRKAFRSVLSEGGKGEEGEALNLWHGSKYESVARHDIAQLASLSLYFVAAAGFDGSQGHRV